MNKDIQENMNKYVLQNMDKMKHELQLEYPCVFNNSVKLRSCNAVVFESTNYYILRSYQTVVACIDKLTGQKFDFLRYVFGYTNTSAQHIRKFFSDYGDFRVNVYTYREV